jgi:homeobox protein cut-like
LEQLLLTRNKKLTNELTILRVSHQDLSSKLLALQTSLQKTEVELQSSQKLTQTLEADLERVQEEASHAFPSSAMSIAPSRYAHSSLPRRGRNVSPTSSIISGFDPHSSVQGTPEDVLRSGVPVGGGSGMLPMITAQRDRYKKKNKELEEALQRQHQAVQSLRSEIASLQKDNLNLYEKTRYVSTYSRGGASGSAYSGAGPRETSIAIGNGGGEVDTRYKAAYESNLSPFAAFRGRESARAFKGMSLPERAVFQVTRLVLATRTSRNLFAGYCLGLHVLLMVMLYQMGGDAGTLKEVVKVTEASFDGTDI